MSRRVQIRSITCWSVVLVWSSGSLRCSQVAGNAGAVHFAFVAHQDDHEPTAARLRFQVIGAHWPHRAVTVAPISGPRHDTPEPGEVICL
jgi:hypothetical protein